MNSGSGLEVDDGWFEVALRSSENYEADINVTARQRKSGSPYPKLENEHESVTTHMWTQFRILILLGQFRESYARVHRGDWREFGWKHGGRGRCG
jgi:hypothetical protein